MIDGVKTKPLQFIPDERGRLMEIIRCDDECFKQFGQVYMTTSYPGVVKAWHCHHVQTDNICCVKGMIKLALYDAREDSPTYGQVEEFFFGEHSPLLLTVPPYVYHGWKCISEEESIIISTPTEPYNSEHPDEYRLPADSPEIPYDWLLLPGRRNG